jgi:prepilin-type N-terminal cleavage/methylation domain-containing protein
MLSRRAQPCGFTIAEVVVSIAILAVLAAVVIPNGTRYLYDSRLRADAALLDSINIARNDFFKAIIKYPGRMSMLARQIHGNGFNAGDSTSCNGTNGGTISWIGVADSSHWNGGLPPTAPAHAGPYFGRPIPSTGLQLSIGVAQDKLVRTSSNSVIGWQNIVIPAVSYADAIALDKIVDGDDLQGPNRTDTAGTLRWATTPSGPRDTVTLRWYMVLRAIPC